MKRLIALAALSVLSMSAAAYADPAYHEWATTHQDWVRLHPERAKYFEAHPEFAEKYRSEWNGWHESKYNEWAEHHPGWVATHKSRHEMFIAHPDAAEKARHEWYEHKENHKEYSEWERTHR